ncbi:MAG: Mbeg1-like protein [Mobilitalea sp.]
MGNIFQYIHEYGDCTFDKEPFNEVDNLIFAVLSYVNFSEVVEGIGSNHMISIRDANKKIVALDYEKDIKDKYLLNTYKMLHKLSKRRRYRDLLLRGFEEILDGEREEQFAAIQILLGNDTVYVSFRGTDDSFIGWKEDCNMFVSMPVPSQEDAVWYIENIPEVSKMKIITGGHSKGGNLAVYASTFCSKEVSDNIVGIYSNDGFGFTEEINSSERYKAVLPKIKKFVPKFCIVGMLLRNEEEFEIIKSKNKGGTQHDGFSWIINGNTFSRDIELNAESVLVNNIMKKWIASMNIHQRGKFVDHLFYNLMACEKRTFMELKINKFPNYKKVLNSYSKMAKEEKQEIKKALNFMFNSIHYGIREYIVTKRNNLMPQKAITEK